MELYNTPAYQLRQMLLGGKVSAVEITESFLSRIKAVEPKIKAYITITDDIAIEQAKEVDRKIAGGKIVGRLAGIPIAVKDNICTRGIRTTCASKMLENFVPPYDAFVVKRLKEEGAIIIGKTNMDEFAMGSSCENSAFFPTKNPWNLDTAPGGSSGGSASAVSAGEAAIALGSDTGGSIRQPAALTGTVGFKPTYGVISRYGLVAFASSLDQIGPIAKCVDDTILVTEAITGRDVMDSTSVSPDSSRDEGSLLRGLTGGQANSRQLPTLNSIKGLRLGVPEEYFGKGVNDEVADAIDEALKMFENAGATLVDINLPLSEYSVATYYIVAPAEASSNLARYDGAHYGYRAGSYDSLIYMYSQTRSEGFGPEVKRRIMLGTYTLSSGYYDAYYLRALKVRRLIKEDFDRAFEKVDVIVGPTSPIPAFRLGEKLSDPLQMYLCDIFTVATNLAGLPAISIPCGFTSDGLPIGLQIQGTAFSDAMILGIARLFEKELGLSSIFPPL